MGVRYMAFDWLTSPFGWLASLNIDWGTDQMYSESSISILGSRDRCENFYSFSKQTVHCPALTTGKLLCKEIVKESIITQDYYTAERQLTVTCNFDAVRGLCKEIVKESISDQQVYVIKSSAIKAHTQQPTCLHYRLIISSKQISTAIIYINIAIISETFTWECDKHLFRKFRGIEKFRYESCTKNVWFVVCVSVASNG